MCKVFAIHCLVELTSGRGRRTAHPELRQTQNYTEYPHPSPKRNASNSNLLEFITKWLIGTWYVIISMKQNRYMWQWPQANRLCSFLSSAKGNVVQLV